MNKMHIDLMRDSSKNFPEGQNLAATAMRVWHCKYKTLAPIGEFKHLKALVINSLPDKDLAWLAGLSSLEYLWIQDARHVTDLSPLGKLQNLQTLSLSTPPSWDSSKKTLCVESLAPLTELKKLAHLELFGVHDHEYSLEAVKQCKKLKSARFSKYPAATLADFYEASPVSDDFAPESPFPD